MVAAPMIAPPMIANDALQTTDYAYSPAVLIFGDGALGPVRAAAEAAGSRVVATLRLADAAGRLAVQGSLAAAIVVLDVDAGDATDMLLDRLDDAARTGKHRSIVVVPAALIDVAAARLDHPGVTLLADPDPVDLITSVAVACAPAEGSGVHDMSPDSGAGRLIELTEEVGRIARRLASASGEPGRMGAPSTPYRLSDTTGGRPVDAPAIRGFIRARRLRDQWFGGGLFADPAWDILLDLAAARKEGRGVAVSSLCIAAAVPPTTALRWIKALGDEGLLVRRADPNDARRVFITLSDDAAAKMDACLDAMRQMLGKGG